MVFREDSPANELSQPLDDIVPDPAKTDELYPRVVDALKTIFDPEIPVNIWELGLIYDVLVDANGRVGVRMTLTAPACPAAQSLPVEVEEQDRRGARSDRVEGRDRLGATLDRTGCLKSRSWNWECCERPAPGGAGARLRAWALGFGKKNAPVWG